MMIEIKNLSFSYGKKKQSVFNDFSLTLDKGSVYGLLGKNGTGKSTLHNLYSDITAWHSGYSPAQWEYLLSDNFRMLLLPYHIAP